KYKLFQNIINRERMVQNSLSFSDVEDEVFSEYKLRVLCEKTNLKKIRKIIYRVHQMLYNSQPKYVRYTDETINATEETYSYSIIIGTKMNIDKIFIDLLEIELGIEKINAKISIVKWQKNL
ncbi:hypothetical protein, partial [Bacillus paralicheniformis]